MFALFPVWNNIALDTLPEITDGDDNIYYDVDYTMCHDPVQLARSSGRRPLL